ncbi:MAG: hypothetical protein IH612_05535 [Desulfofustis sp.]|nr:hypothetical protein [Desulfofustis sp.]
MQQLYPFFIQYHVRQISLPPSPSSAVREGLATIIVFADSWEVARTRAGRAVAENELEIVQLARIHLIGEHSSQGFDKILRSLFQQAELYGISIYCDYWPIRSGCCADPKPTG